MSDFLTQGPKVLSIQHPAIGIRFINLNNHFELIGEIFQVIEGIVFIKDPILLTRDTQIKDKFNFIPFHKANPVVENEIQAHFSAITFMCKPKEQFIKNYLVARSGLVTAMSIRDIRDIGIGSNGQ